MLNLDGKIVVITGASSGIGEACAREFAILKANIILAARRVDRLKKLADQLEKEYQIKVNYLEFDVRDYDDVQNKFNSLDSYWKQIDILVNNAGINLKKEFTEVTDEDFQNIITTNVTAVFTMSREVVKHMLPRGTGNIINISSMAAQYGLPKVIAYSASKTAIDGMTRAMAVELSPKRIRVNAIAPGFIYSAMTEKALTSDPERKAKVFGRTPMGHMGQPEDIGNAAAFLVSDAAKYITGIIMPVDGGNSIGF